MKGELAKEYHKSGLNCAQAVLLAFKDEISIPEEDLLKLIIGFGGGFARQRHVCGAVSGMTAVIGYLKSTGKDKLEAYAIVKKALDEFLEKAGSLICADLMDRVDGKIPCGDLCYIAAEIADKIVKE